MNIHPGGEGVAQKDNLRVLNAACLPACQSCQFCRGEKKHAKAVPFLNSLTMTMTLTTC